MKSFPENRENIILADCEEEELQEFVEGIQSVIGEKFVIKNKICNGGHGKLTNIKRYLIYAIYPLCHVRKYNNYGYVFGWQQFFALFYVFYCRLFRVKKKNIVVAVNFTYKEKSNFVGKIYRKFMEYCVQSKYLDYIHVPSWNYARICAKEFKLPEEKFIVTPFGLPDTYEKWKETTVEYKDYSFSIGRSNRDFDFLVNAWKGMPKNELLVIASDTFQPKEPLPENIIHRKDIRGDSQFPYIANCKAMIIPIDDGAICSGDTVLLKAMSYEKLVIVTVPSTLGEMYINNGVDGLLVEKNEEKFVKQCKSYFEIGDKKIQISKKARLKYVAEYSRYSMGKNLADLIINSKCEKD